MKRYVMAFFTTAMVIVYIVTIFFLIKAILKVHHVQNFEVGKCYQMVNENPFDTELHYMKVVDKKGKYVKYLMSGKYPSSSTARFITGVYEIEIDCEKVEQKK
jgi:hypothetical protein